jgi:hypothetical protein
MDSYDINKDALPSDYYVYEWYIKETGEVFYVGMGRCNSYKEYNKYAYEAEKIKTLYDTGNKFIAKNLTESDASEIKSKEITRILNETTDRLTNRVTSLFADRDNGYGRSKNTPIFKFEIAPTLYAAEIDEHYYGIKGKNFDNVNTDCLASVVFIENRINAKILDIVYGGKYKSYFDETILMLNSMGYKILKTKFSKSVTAWIHSGDDYVTNYNIDQEKAKERIGRNIPTYHLIDVWKKLRSISEKHLSPPTNPQKVLTDAIHSRVPLEKIKNLNNWEKGFDAGYKFWEQGDELRKSGNIENSIKLFDKARYFGYNAPVLYNSYAMAYRKLKDYDNEIEILYEGIERHRRRPQSGEQIIIKWEEQIKKASQNLLKK